MVWGNFLNILATQYTLATKSFEIYVAGCNGNPHCSSCHNAESWNFNQGTKYTEDYFKQKIESKVKEFNELINNIMIFGGEPLDQDHNELMSMLNDLDKLNLPIWIFTRYDIKDVPEEIKEYCDYIKCGRYLPELTTETNNQYGIKLATSNQKIYRKGVDF